MNVTSESLMAVGVKILSRGMWCHIVGLTASIQGQRKLMQHVS
jgi:hypothetical protein